MWALQRWGLPVLPRLAGQFAFAALDLRGGRLLLVRDRFGIKPLYLARFDGAAYGSPVNRTLRSAVHGALLADATVGTLCSGGIDSSLITALAVEAKPDLVAFGASNAADEALDEGPAARRVADALGIELELIDVTPADWRRGFVAEHYPSRQSDRECERGHDRATG